MAAALLMKNGYTLLERNYRYGKAEIDLIALKGDTLSIVEVKSRSSDLILDPKEAVTARKIRRLTLAADAYVIANDLEVEVRFDIISIIKEKKGYRLEHIEDAFYHF